MSYHKFIPVGVGSRRGSDGRCSSQQATRRAWESLLTMPAVVLAVATDRVRCTALRSSHVQPPVVHATVAAALCAASQQCPARPVSSAPPPLSRVRLHTTAPGLRGSPLVARGVGLAQVRGAARLQRIAVARLQLGRQLRRRRPWGGARHILRLPPLLAERPVCRVEVVALLLHPRRCRGVPLCVPECRTLRPLLACSQTS